MTEKHNPPGKAKTSAGGWWKTELLLLFLGGVGGLRGLRLDHALLELIDAPGGIDKFLCAGVKGMANVADADHQARLGGAGLDDVAAGATNLRLNVFRM